MPSIIRLLKLACNLFVFPIVGCHQTYYHAAFRLKFFGKLSNNSDQTIFSAVGATFAESINSCSKFCSKDQRCVGIEMCQIREDLFQCRVCCEGNKTGNDGNKHPGCKYLELYNANGEICTDNEDGKNRTNNENGENLRYLHKSCMDILQSNPCVKGKDGAYSITGNEQEKKVYCDMTTDGGGWTAIQKRQDGSTDFYRTWADYKKGFGDPSNNYWIGNDAIHYLTQTNQELRVEVLSFADEKAHALYSAFQVGNESSKYRLTVSGYSGTAGDSLKYHNGMEFSTRDQDNDPWDTVNCAVGRQGAWWYKKCDKSNLNGEYIGFAASGEQYPVWDYWKYNIALKGTAMLIRPKT